MDTASIVVKLMDGRDELKAKLPAAEARAERLEDAAVAYEEATDEDPTDAEHRRLNRFIMVGRRARDKVERLEQRIELVELAMSSLEEAEELARKRSPKKSLAELLRDKP